MKSKALISLGTLTLALATAATLTAFTLTGGNGGGDALEKDVVGTQEPAFLDDSPTFDPIQIPPVGSSDPNASVGITSGGETFILEPGEANGASDEEPGVVHPLPPAPVRSDQGLDPDECNLVHNLNACDADELKAGGIGPIEGSEVHDLESCDDEAGGFSGREVPQGQFEQHGPKLHGDPPPPPTLDPAGEEAPVVSSEPITPEEHELYIMAREDLGQRFGLEPDSVRLSYIERVTWSTLALGDPQPGMAYADILVPGFRMVLEAAGESYAYHTSMDRVVFVESVEYSELAMTTPEQKRVATAVATAERVPNAGEGSATPECLTPPPSHDEPAEEEVSPVYEITEQVSILTYHLRATGALVEDKGEVTFQPFLSSIGQVISINGESVQVFEYSDVASADTEAARISADGSQISDPPTLIGWISVPHYYKMNNLIALYVGDNTAVTDALEAVMGAQFAGG